MRLVKVTSFLRFSKRYITFLCLCSIYKQLIIIFLQIPLNSVLLKKALIPYSTKAFAITRYVGVIPQEYEYKQTER